MIKITKIRPVGKDNYVDISSIEVNYLSKFKKYTQPEELLKASLYRNIGYKPRNKTQKAILQYLIDNFDKIILAEPIKLYRLINEFDKKGWNREINKKVKKGNFSKALLEMFGYEHRFRNNLDRGIWLAKEINIKSCPYCNAQYTILVQDHKKRSIAKFQFDHFFPKNEYPYLSISLYNLIPSCANCNITKSNKPLNLSTHYHPYYNDFAIRSKFYLKHDPNPLKLTIKEVENQDLEIQFKPKFMDKDGLVQKHDELYDITAVYNRHKDIAADLLISAILYNSAKSNYMTIKGLFPSNDLFKNYLIGTFSGKESILERPLTKFRQDIAKQLGVI